MDATDNASGGTTRSPAETVAKLQAKFDQRLQRYLDLATPQIALRWAAWVTIVTLYALRVFFLKGFYIVTYGLGIFNLNLLLGFLTPQQDPEGEGPDLPTKSDQEFRPFVRRLPEFKFWYASTKSFLIGMVMTLFSVFDVPVFWPILLLYWIVLVALTMKRQIKHMIKHKYVPWSTGKKTYGSGKAAGKGAAAARKD